MANIIQKQFVVLASLDNKKFSIAEVGENYPMIYKVIGGPTSRDECKKIIDSLIKDNPLSQPHNDVSFLKFSSKE